MGYALFASRKLFYTNMLNTLQLQLDNIMIQKQHLLNFSANISDGIITVEEIASDPTNFRNYGEYLQNADAYINMADDEGGAGTTIGEIGSMAASQNSNEEYLASIAEMLNTAVNQEFAQQQNKKLAVIENQLDMQQQKLETKISVAEQQLQATIDAEGKAIERSTPKYNGVG